MRNEGREAKGLYSLPEVHGPGAGLGKSGSERIVRVPKFYFLFFRIIV